MQLAASQRPVHPPPVPPRPSRQVVAEALKKSAKPPCPSRQAPPPPNKKPWRDNGRTVIYDSSNCADEIDGKNKDNRVNASLQSKDDNKQVKTIDEPKKVQVVAEKLEERSKKCSRVTFEEDKKSLTISSDDDGATVVVIEEPKSPNVSVSDDSDNNNIQHQDWLEAGIRYSSTKITLSGDDHVNGYNREERDAAHEFADLDFSSILERIAMSSLQGLPPLPRSLSGFNLNNSNGARLDTGEPPPPPTRSSSKASQRSAKSTPNSGSQNALNSRPSPPARQLTTLDTQLAILRREMFGLRQLDLSLLSQLWSLNESIQEFRQLLQEQEDRAPSPSPSSDEGDDMSYRAHPPPPPRRPPTSGHHHKPTRPPRPPKPPPSDESPSSEEYGAV